MSEIEYDDFSDDDQPETEQRQNPVRAQLKRLEKENAELRKQTQQFAETQKKLAFVEAGIALDSPMAKYFIKGYDGELSPEAIREAAMEAQLIAPPTPVNEADKSGWKETNRIAAGAESHPEAPGWAKRISDAQSESEIMSIFAEAQAAGINLSEL
jgi:hypothetical protein